MDEKSKAKVAITKVDPTSAAVGDHKAQTGNGVVVKISGSGFGGKQGTSFVTIAGDRMKVVSWSDTLISAELPWNAHSGHITVAVGNEVVTTEDEFTIQ